MTTTVGTRTDSYEDDDQLHRRSPLGRPWMSRPADAPPREPGALSAGKPHCPSCSAKGTTLYTGLRDRLYGTPGAWSTLRCPDCAHAWLDPYPEPEEIPRLYESYYTHTPHPLIPSAGARPNLRLSAGRGLLSVFGYERAPQHQRERRLGTMLNVFPPFREWVRASVMFLDGRSLGSLLDVGCGEGSFIEQMQLLGWRVTGVEPDREAVRIAKDRGLPVVQGTAEDIDLPEERYDAVTLNHVIEHVHDPIMVLERCRHLLRRNGRLVIKTPNINSLGHQIFGASWMPLDPPRHLNLFSARSLGRCAERAGLDVLTLRTTAFTAHHVFDASRALSTAGFCRIGEKHEATFQGYVFRFAEEAIRSVRDEAGEEILLIAQGNTRS